LTEALIILRSIHFAATILAAGTVFFAVLVAEPVFAGTRRKMRKEFDALNHQWIWLVWLALAVAVVSGACWLVLLTSDIYGAPIVEVCFHGGVWTVATDTRFGLVSTFRLALAATLAITLYWPPDGRDPQSFLNVMRLLLAALFTASLASVGHAGAAPGHAAHLHYDSDIVHLLAASLWIGSLVPLAMLLARAYRARGKAWRAIAAAATRRFSGLGVVSVAALLVSGSINTWHSLDSPADLLTTNYGRLILLKIGLFTAMLGIAAVNRFHLTPRLAKRGALRALERNSLGEAGLGLCVMVLVGILGTMPPPGHAHGPATDIPADAAFVHIHMAEVMADVTIVPGRIGAGRATIRLLREDFSQFPAKDVVLTLTSPAANAKPQTHPATRIADDTWQADKLDLTQAGVWIVKVIVTTGARNPVLLDAPIVIER